MTDVETALPGMPELPESSTDDCGCDAKFAEVTRVLEMQTTKIAELTSAVNSVGSLVQGLVDRAGGFLNQFNGMNPLDVMKGLFSGKQRG